MVGSGGQLPPPATRIQNHAHRRTRHNVCGFAWVIGLFTPCQLHARTPHLHLHTSIHTHARTPAMCLLCTHPNIEIESATGFWCVLMLVCVCSSLGDVSMSTGWQFVCVCVFICANFVAGDLHAPVYGYIFIHLSFANHANHDRPLAGGGQWGASGGNRDRASLTQPLTHKTSCALECTHTQTVRRRANNIFGAHPSLPPPARPQLGATAMRQRTLRRARDHVAPRCGHRTASKRGAAIQREQCRGLYTILVVSARFR